MEIPKIFTCTRHPLKRQQTPNTNYSICTSLQPSPNITPKSKYSNTSQFHPAFFPNAKSIDIDFAYSRVNRKIEQVNNKCVKLLESQGRVHELQILIEKKKLGKLHKRNCDSKSFKIWETQIVQVESANKEETIQLNALIKEYFSAFHKLQEANQVLKETIEKANVLEEYSNELVRIRLEKKKLLQITEETDLLNRNCLVMQKEIKESKEENKKLRESMKKRDKEIGDTQRKVKDLIDSEIYVATQNQFIRGEIRDLQNTLEKIKEKKPKFIKITRMEKREIKSEDTELKNSIRRRKKEIQKLAERVEQKERGLVATEAKMLNNEQHLYEQFYLLKQTYSSR